MSRSDPATGFVAVAPSDTAALTTPTRALFIGGAGDIIAVGGNGTPVTFKAVPAGALLPIVAVRINATGTTATDIVALF